MLLEPTPLARTVLVQREIGQLYLVMSAPVTTWNGVLLFSSCCRKMGEEKTVGKLLISGLPPAVTGTFLLQLFPGYEHPVLLLCLLPKGEFELPILDEKEVSPNPYFQILLVLQQKYLQQVSAACNYADKS